MSASSSSTTPSLPTSAYTVYEDAYRTDALAALADLQVTLPLAFYTHDEPRIAFYLRRLQQTLELKQGPTVVTREIKQGWIQMLMTQLLTKGETLPMHLQTKVMHAIDSLYAHEKEYSLAFDWKDLYNYLARYHLNDSTRSISNFSNNQMVSHSHALVKLISKSRRYFRGGENQTAVAAAAAEQNAFANLIGSANKSAGEEILNTFIPFLSPFDNKYFASQALICLFFPTHLRHGSAEGKAATSPDKMPAASIASIHQLLKLYSPFTSNLIDFCPTTIQLNVQLYSRLAKHALGIETGDGVEILAPFVAQHRSTLFRTFLQILELDIAGKSSQNRHRTWTCYQEFVYAHGQGLSSIADYFAKFVVYTLHYENATKEEEKKDSTQGLLTSLLFIMRTYVHPSHTSGRAWHDAIGTFLVRLSVYYCKRLGREVRGEVPYDKKYFLNPKNYDFVTSIQPIILQGLYSKSPAMISHCEISLKNFSTFFPHLILPGLMRSIEESLADVNMAHRMMSSLQVLTNMANIAFNAELSVNTSGGAPWLMNLLNLSLPGIDIIDPLKTTFTMTWLAVLLYAVPLIDARDGGSTGEEDVKLPDKSKLTPAARFSLELSNPTQEAYSEAVEIARTATMQFEEWSLAYVDAIVRLLASSDKFAPKDYIDQAFARLLYKNMRAFFAALSPKIFASVSKKLINLVMTEHHPTAQKHWGCIIHTMSLGQTETFLKAFVPGVLKKIVVKDALAPLAASELEWYVHLLGQAVKQGGGATECPDAIAAGMNGKLLLPYVAACEQVYQLVHNHDEKDVRKAARKMLRNLLKGLTFTYPAEYRNFSPVTEWSRINDGTEKDKKITKHWQHWKAWGTYKPKSENRDGMPEVDCLWHVPTAEELQVAESIVRNQMKAPLTWLINWIDGVEQPREEKKEDGVSEEKKDAVAATGKGDTPLERNLQNIISLCRGVQTVMGSIEGEDFYADAGDDDHDKLYAKNKDNFSRCPMNILPRTQPVGSIHVQEILTMASTQMKGQAQVKSLRTHLLRVLHQAFLRSRALASGPVHSQPSTKSNVLLLQFATQVLTGYGVNERHVLADRYNGRYSRQRLRDLLSGIRSRLRPQLVQKLSDFHGMRLNELSYNEKYTSDVRDVIQDLHHAAADVYTLVRSAAKSLLISSLRRFPQAIDLTLDAMLEVFSNPTGKTSDESLLGCMSVLVDHSMTNWIARNWMRMSRFIQTFFKYGESTSKDDKVQLQMQGLFNAIFAATSMRAVNYAPISSTIPEALTKVMTPANVAQRNQSIARYNKKLGRTYLELMSFLHHHSSGSGTVAPAASPTNGASAATNGTDDKRAIHWRYSLMSSAFFFHLSRENHYASAIANVDVSDGYISYHQYVTFFLKGLTSTLAPLRQISFVAINKVLGTHSLHVRSELNRQAEEALGIDAAKVLTTMDQGTTTPLDPAASLSKTGSILTFTSIDSEKELRDTVFYDYLYSGWMGDIYNTVVCKYSQNTNEKFAHYNAFTYFTPLSISSPLKFPYKPLAHTTHSPVAPLSDATQAAILEFFTNTKNLQGLVDSFVHAHPSLAPTIDGQASERADNGAGEQIASLVRRSVMRHKLFPTTRFNAKSGAFDMIHVNVIRGLVELFPQLVLNETNDNGIIGMVKVLLKTTEEPDKACTAAEILCGITTAIKHFTHEVQVKFQKILLPVFTLALRTVQPESLDHFGDCLRLIYMNQDARRLAWLSRALFLEALNELPSNNFIEENLANTQINPRILHMKQAGVASLPPSPSASSATAARNLATNAGESSSVQFKRLRFLLPALIEVGFRGTKLGEWLVTTFKKKGYLYHPYKQVREEVSWILFILSRNEFSLCKNHPAQSPGGSALEPAATLSVVSSPVYLQFLNYIKGQFDTVKALYRDDKNAIASTSNSELDGAVLEAHTKHIAAQKDRAKAFIETVLTWLHATLVCGDMVFISTFYQAFLPYVLWSQCHPDPEIGALGKFASAGASWINAGGQPLSQSASTEPEAPAQGLNSLVDTDSLPYVQTLSLTDSSSKRAPLDSPSAVIDNILSNLRSVALAEGTSWHTRVAVARFLQIWLPRHSLALTAAQLKSVESLLIDSLLIDVQIEVREAASQAFQSFISSSFPLTLPTRESLLERTRELQDSGEEEVTGSIVLNPHPHIEVLTKQLKKLVKNAGASSSSSSTKSSSKSLDAAGVAQKHGALLGLTGLVLTHPYDVPSHLPSLLSYLAPFVEDRNNVISSSLRKFFASFTSSHKDEWPVFSKQFTQEQLEELASMQLAPSYFA